MSAVWGRTVLSKVLVRAVVMLSYNKSLKRALLMD